MIKTRRIIDAPYPSNFLFDIAQDVENYPYFLPHCIGARIREKGKDLWRVENVYRWGPASYKFITHADVRPHSTIHITSAPSEPIQLEVKWSFEEITESQTQITFEMGFATRLPLLEKLVGGMLDQIAEETEHAFLKRAQSLS
ncbi:type II toxin-antitoxin system RatA family toxin [Terasakiella sp. A23]|uniref:type II toxin-antitoxin system RatA family toxin n=1 Tax=Terasakiella sp. FCG-A23 TaxID=3080561 RepID=UPI002953318C|nr:type II toxin-antitoxin system RatA family toxin [Terasakiella sp. A23]MDV7341069.1 type II toxin-antitoxin system RatA family toxin [Terasakiella sp. A23]